MRPREGKWMKARKDNKSKSPFWTWITITTFSSSFSFFITTENRKLYFSIDSITKSIFVTFDFLSLETFLVLSFKNSRYLPQRKDLFLSWNKNRADEKKNKTRIAFHNVLMMFAWKYIFFSLCFRFRYSVLSFCFHHKF